VTSSLAVFEAVIGYG